MEILRLNQISPDQLILWQMGFAKITATLLYTWFIMAILIIGSWLVTRKISKDIHISRWQNLLEVIVSTIRGQIMEITKDNPDHYLAFIGTLFLLSGCPTSFSLCPDMSHRPLPLQQQQRLPYAYSLPFLCMA